MKNITKIASLLIFVTCLGFGYLAGRSAGRTGSKVNLALPVATPTSPTTETPTAPQFAQRNVLVIGVDRLARQNLRLKSIWMVVFAPSTPKLILLPLYPLTDEEKLEQNQHLEDTFRLDPDFTPNPDFLSALKAQDLQWDHFVILDEIALADLVDIAGGIETDDGHFGGVQAVAVQSESWKQPQSVLRMQVSLLNGLCRSEARLTQATSPAYMYDLLAHHMRTDIPLEQAIAEWEKLRSSNAPLSCEFPTLGKNLPVKGKVTAIAP